jgi:ElaB/YqjD/DUF883 family membrane-anchored ribosome-binding protein
MPSQEVAITISTNTEQAQASVKSFKTQLREANGELVSMAEKFGSASTEAITAAKKVARLKDAIGDAKALAETFNPDKKFVALGGAIQGAVSGFSALQGVQGLFGSESKELEKTLLKVQSAMVLQQGISGVFASVDSFKLLANTIKTNVITSLTTLRGALIATGLGALAVGVGLLIANFDKVKQVVLNLIPGLASVGKFIGGLVDRITDFIGVTSDASRELAKMREEADKSLKLNNKYLAQHGDQLDKYTKAKIDAKNKYLEAVKDETLSEKDRIELAKRAGREIAKADKDRADDIAKARSDEEKKAADKQKQIDDKKLADLKAQRDKLKEIEKKLNEDLRNENAKSEEEKLQAQMQKDLDDLNAIKLSEKEKQEARKLIKEKYYIAEIDLANKRKQEQVDKDAKTLEDATKSLDEQDQADFERNKKNFIVKLQQQKDYDNAVLEHKKAIADAEFNIASGAVNLLKMLAGQNEALQKVAIIAEGAISVAKIITSTQAANAAVTAKYALIPGGIALAAAERGLNRVNAAIGIATTVAATAKALSAIGSGGGISGGSLPAGSGSSAPILPQASSTTINQGQVNQIGNVAARAFVVESDVSGNQERIRRLNRAARIS